MTQDLKPVTVTAPVNIAVIKYWGKRDETLILPTNPSLSVTLDTLVSRTSVEPSPSGKDCLLLNGSQSDLTPRIAAVLKAIRAHAPAESALPAGLASSASGLAALAFALAEFYAIDVSRETLSGIARLGSGSACRSVFGGFVEWEAGKLADGSDSLARQVAPASHWPEMAAVICVVSDRKKETSSTAGMQTSVATSELMATRIRDCVPKRIEDIKKAILEKDFETFAEITMRESNQFHAICLDTWPPIFYLTDVSKQIMQMVHAYNKEKGSTRLAYTFDAGPNAVIYSPYPDALEDITQMVSSRFSEQEVSKILRSGIGHGPEIIG
ncbi:MAG: hypothetical protein SGCHY_004351 [Lobulomycetales sp.]